MGMEILKVCLCRNQDQSQIKSKTELETHLTDSSHLDPEAEREISPLIVDEGDHTPDNSYANHSAWFIQSYGEGLTSDGQARLGLIAAFSFCLRPGFSLD